MEQGEQTSLNGSRMHCLESQPQVPCVHINQKKTHAASGFRSCLYREIPDVKTQKLFCICIGINEVEVSILAMEVNDLKKFDQSTKFNIFVPNFHSTDKMLHETLLKKCESKPQIA